MKRTSNHEQTQTRIDQSAASSHRRGSAADAFIAVDHRHDGGQCLWQKQPTRGQGDACCTARRQRVGNDAQRARSTACSAARRLEDDRLYGGTPKGDFEAQLAALAPKTSWTLSELLAAKFPAPQEPPRGKRKQGIVQLLSERGALTRDDLHAAVGGSTTALDAALMDLKLDGYIEISDGRYRIREYPDHDNA